MMTVEPQHGMPSARCWKTLRYLLRKKRQEGKRDQELELIEAALLNKGSTGDVVAMATMKGAVGP